MYLTENKHLYRIKVLIGNEVSNRSLNGLNDSYAQGLAALVRPKREEKVGSRNDKISVEASAGMRPHLRQKNAEVWRAKKQASFCN